MKINYKLIIKIVSVVLVLCSFISVFLIPVSAESFRSSSFHEVFQLDSVFVVLEDYSGSNTYSLFRDKPYTNYVAGPGGDDFAMYNFPLAAKGAVGVHFVSNDSLTLEKGDVFSLNLSILAPYCGLMTLAFYDYNGIILHYADFERSSAVYTNNYQVLNNSLESKSYGDKVYCHRYTLNEQFVSTDGKDIAYMRINTIHDDSTPTRKFWIAYEDCNFYFKSVDTVTDNSSFNVLGKIWTAIKDFFNMSFNFILDFGTKIKGSVSPLFNNVSTWISDSTTTVWNNFKTVLTNIKDGITSIPQKLSNLGNVIISPIKSIPESISNWFQNTFLGKVLRITNKSKAFISQAGNDVQYAALDDEVGESTEAISPDDWDMIHRPSFEIDVDYYNNLYPNVFDTGG